MKRNAKFRPASTSLDHALVVACSPSTTRSFRQYLDQFTGDQCVMKTCRSRSKRRIPFQTLLQSKVILLTNGWFGSIFQCSVLTLHACVRNFSHCIRNSSSLVSFSLYVWSGKNQQSGNVYLFSKPIRSDYTKSKLTSVS